METNITLNKEDVFNLIPTSAFQLFNDLAPSELEYLVKFNLNIDEQDSKKHDILKAYSFWQTAKDEEKANIRLALSQMSVSYLLEYIAENHFDLFTRIELLHNNNILVIQWLELQTIRVKAMIMEFDEMIKDERDNNNILSSTNEEIHKTN